MISIALIWASAKTGKPLLDNFLWLTLIADVMIVGAIFVE